MVHSVLVDLEVGRNAYGRVLDQALAEIGVTTREAVVLRLLVSNPRVTVATVRLSTAMPASTVTSVLNRLEAADLVRRERLGGDRRFVVIRATWLGRYIGEVVSVTIDEIGQVMSAVPGSDVESLPGVARVLHDIATRPSLDPLS